MRTDDNNGYLDGQFLVAMPAMSDKRFARSVIYMCAHSGQGAMGLIVNQRASHISFPELLGQLSIGGTEGEQSPLGAALPKLCDLLLEVGNGALESGAVGMVTKPVDGRELFRFIDKLMKTI